jgi:ornithine cyclodeaminase
MRFLPEQVTAALVDHELAFKAAERALIVLSQADAHSFPVVLGHGADVTNRFSVKSGSAQTLTGLKVGSYWPSNDALGLPRHSSTILLFDTARGRIDAVIEGSMMNAYRTSAADAVAVDRLARRDAHHLAIFGAGHQAFFECQAISRIRSLENIWVINRTYDRSDSFAARLRAIGLPAKAALADEACAAADIIVTATGSRAPLFDAALVRPGTHISCMGADGRGKQELPTDLAARAELFCDLPQQSIEIGEFQHISDRVRGGQITITALGAVLSGQHPGRQNDHAITIFDSSGTAIQDLVIAEIILREAEQQGRVLIIPS